MKRDHRIQIKISVVYWSLQRFQVTFIPNRFWFSGFHLKTEYTKVIRDEGF
jgi:hypothetical protein